MVPKASLAHERSGFEFGILIGIGSGKSDLWRKAAARSSETQSTANPPSIYAD
jgi:hypothetical protein